MTDTAAEEEPTLSAAELEKIALRETVLAEEKKRKKIKLGILGGLAFFTLLLWFMLQPLRAGPEYGLCRTYLETYLRYPTTFKITEYDVFGRSLRIFFSYHDEWGGHRSEMIECIASPDTVNGFVMEDIKINRNPITKEKLKLFNNAIPGILLSEPDLIIPRPPRDKDLMGLKRD